MSPSIDWAPVAAIWAASGRTPATISKYLYWARRFDAYCRTRGWDPISRLTSRDARRIGDAYPRCRVGSERGNSPVVPVRALSCALAALGHSVPPWSATRAEPRLAPLVERYVRHRLRYRGVTAKASRFDARCAAAFIGYLARRGRTVRTLRILDIDDFVIANSKRLAPKSLAAICSSLRAFLRYVHLAGVAEVDLAAHVASPRVRAADAPPRAVPWRRVRSILRAIDTRSPLGRRDKALFLMMATYGMGAGEVIGLQLDDVDWRARRLHVRRPKTGVVTELPLLDAVGRVLAEYLRRGRPAHASTRAVFVSAHMPHGPLSGSTTIRHRLALYAARAGIRDGYLGTHLFRHSHATRQIEQGQRPKVVGDILGHRRPESTSVYARSAVGRLRALALPVPR